jgi:hypothetical protein
VVPETVGCFIWQTQNRDFQVTYHCHSAR